MTIIAGIRVVEDKTNIRVAKLPGSAIGGNHRAGIGCSAVPRPVFTLDSGLYRICRFSTAAILPVNDPGKSGMLGPK